MARRNRPELTRHRTSARILFCCVLVSLFAACTARPKPPTGEISQGPTAAQFVALSGHSPPFARVPFEPFSRADAVAVAHQEWLLFGQRVDDAPPPDRYIPELGNDPERLPGLWERIGEYWWLGQNADSPAAGWTGMHDENGQEFDEQSDDDYAWSAAFISYIMRTSGAGARFPYASSHSAYINIAKEMRLGQASGWVVFAERPDEYAPLPGDLVCYSREKRRRVTFERLPVRHFAAHCDIVVARDKNEISVIGGNVDHAVTMKHIPVTTDGRLAEPGGEVLDARYPWLVVLRILYDR